MGLGNLCLVEPKDFPSEEANKMAAGAGDVIETAQVCDSIETAVKECVVVIATSARSRNYDLPCLSPKEAAALLASQCASNKVAVIFGPERMGLHNDDLKHARYRLEIPANPVYPSLNLAAAVQILSYELYQQAHCYNNKPPEKTLPSSETVEHLHAHLEQVLRKVSFLRPHEGETLARLRNFIHRAEPELLDINILRGILSAVERNLD